MSRHQITCILTWSARMADIAYRLRSCRYRPCRRSAIGYQPVPRGWFPAELAGVEVLCLASGGGQQGPVLSAAGAAVTVLDNSPRQLGRDQEVAAREGLAVRTVLGDMRDLSAFPDASFDVVFNPVSNVFCPGSRTGLAGVISRAAPGRNLDGRVHEP